VEPDRPRLTIIGLGLIGGSLGLALKKAGIAHEIVGHTRRFEVAQRARAMGAIDRAEWNLPAAVSGADIVILAVPPRAMAALMEQMAPHLQAGAIVTDVGSTKQEIIAAAESALPPNVAFVGGHPMAGREQAGLEHAEAGLFQGATYCVVAGPRSTDRAVDVVHSLARAVGGHPFTIDAAEHDSLVAAVSHLPFVTAAALVRVAAGSPSWVDLQRLAAGGFRDGTRTASGDVVMHRDIALSNRQAIVRWLDDLVSELQRVRATILDGDAGGLEAWFAEAKQERDTWLERRGDWTVPGAAVPMPPRGELTDSLLGRFGRLIKPREQ